MLGLWTIQRRICSDLIKVYKMINKLSKDDQLQCPLQVVAKHHKQYPQALKWSLVAKQKKNH